MALWWPAAATGAHFGCRASKETMRPPPPSPSPAAKLLKFPPRIGPLFWPWEKVASPPFSLLLFSFLSTFLVILSVVGIFKVDNFHGRSSLERLQLDQIGIGQLHWSTANYAPLQEQALWDGLVAMYEEPSPRLLKHHYGHLLQVAINWCICKGTIPIPGVKSVKQAEENLGSLGWRLSSDEIFELESAAKSSPKKMIQNIFQTR
ncbi:hypothetical protein BHE74_00027803 [Ensete ventricosum]|nr:hypothetical protein GW17_00053060 [Ensete ventricosum]RWW64928.1 hypothetical protein BHE74_00027803 [Ensete ventricosum]RZR89746.1 hypothetical protein BHM03_00017517 [Ensete ventricosum]